MPEMDKCWACDFSQPAHRGKPWCNLTHDFAENLGEFCPKELDIQEIKKRCKYYLPAEKTIGGDALCLVPLQDGGYSDLCWMETFDDLLRDPDFKVKKSAL